MRKGLPNVMWHLALPVLPLSNATPLFLSSIFLDFGAMGEGAIVVEMVFLLNDMGLLIHFALERGGFANLMCRWCLPSAIGFCVLGLFLLGIAPRKRAPLVPVL